ncbi:MAG: ester cyclase [Actinomycetota bacterium]
MSEENKLRMKAFYEEVMNSHNVKAFDDFLTDDFVEHEDLTQFGLTNDAAGVKEWMGRLFKAFPDASVSMEDVATEGDKVWARIRIRGTNTGEMMGMPPTGKSIDVQAIDIVAVREGKAYEHWGVTDNAAMMQQLGLAPPPPGA